MTDVKFESTLIKKTRELLQNRPRTVSYAMIADDTGLTLRWIQEFATNTDADYGACRVEQLYIYLSGKQLAV